MPTRRAWLDLGKRTVLDLDPADVSDLYSIEWRDARDVLLAEHRGEIDAARSRFGRGALKVSALLYGLVQRLAPARRLVVLAILLVAAACGVRMIGSDWPDSATGTVITLLVALGLLVLLLGMELVDKLRFRDELTDARALQAELVLSDLPQAPGYSLGAFNRVANTVGGDIYEFTPLPDGRLSVLFGDASGHGMAAGLVMAVAHTAYRLQLEQDPSPGAVVDTLNRVLCRTGSCRTRGPRQFFSGVALLFEADGRFTLVVAGHPPVLRVDGTGTVVERFGKGSYPLGIKPASRYGAETGALAPGESLVLHSDGLTEAVDADGREYGDARVLRVLARRAGADAPTVAAAMATDVLDFVGRRVPEDDVTIAVVRREPAAVPPPAA